MEPKRLVRAVPGTGTSTRTNPGIQAIHRGVLTGEVYLIYPCSSSLAGLSEHVTCLCRHLRARGEPLITRLRMQIDSPRGTTERRARLKALVLQLTLLAVLSRQTSELGSWRSSRGTLARRNANICMTGQMQGAITRIIPCLCRQNWWVRGVSMNSHPRNLQRPPLKLLGHRRVRVIDGMLSVPDIRHRLLGKPSFCHAGTTVVRRNSPCDSTLKAEIDVDRRLVEAEVPRMKRSWVS